MLLHVVEQNNDLTSKSLGDLKLYFHRLFEQTQTLNIRSLQRQELETSKLAVIQELKRRISVALNEQSQNNTVESKCNSSVNYFAYYFCLFGGFIQTGSESYLFGSTLFALIPGLANPWLLCVSLVYVVLDAVLFYAFDAAQLRDSLNIEYTSTGVSQLMQTYALQLQEVTALNEKLSKLQRVEGLSLKDYAAYIACLKICNEDIRHKQKTIGAYPESSWRKFCKSAIWVFGAFASVAGDYFIASALLGLISSSSVGTPVGWVITILLALSGLGLYCAMEGRSVANLVNPDFRAFKDLKHNLTLFDKSKNYDSDLDLALGYKNRLALGVSSDIAA